MNRSRLHEAFSLQLKSKEKSKIILHRLLRGLRIQPSVLAPRQGSWGCLEGETAKRLSRDKERGETTEFAS